VLGLGVDAVITNRPSEVMSIVHEFLV